MKTPTTQTRLENLIQADLDAGRKVQWLEIADTDRASMVEELRKVNSPLTKAMKKNGIEAAMPTLNGVPLRWGTGTTQTKVK